MPVCTIFSQWFTCHRSGSSKMVTVSNSCSIHTIALYHSPITNPVSINSGYSQWFMPCLYHIALIFIYYGFGLWTITSGNDSCLIHTILDWNNGQAVGSPFNFMSLLLLLLRAFSRIFPMGGWGWSWKGLKVIVTGSLQLDIW